MLYVRFASFSRRSAWHSAHSRCTRRRTSIAGSAVAGLSDRDNACDSPAAVTCDECRSGDESSERRRGPIGIGLNATNKSKACHRGSRLRRGDSHTFDRRAVRSTLVPGRANDQRENRRLSSRVIWSAPLWVAAGRWSLTFWSPKRICRRAFRLTFIRQRKIRSSPSRLDIAWWCDADPVACCGTLRPSSAWIDPWSCLSMMSYTESPWISRSS